MWFDSSNCKKQGCILGPALYDMMFTAMLSLSDAFRGGDDSIYINCWVQLSGEDFK